MLGDHFPQAREIVEVSHDELELLTSMLNPLSSILIPVQVTSLKSACPNGNITDMADHDSLDYRPMIGVSRSPTHLHTTHHRHRHLVLLL